jgi:hypothetical protein
MTPQGPLATALLLCLTAAAQAGTPIDRYDVVWDSPSEDSRGSMPLDEGGNGQGALQLMLLQTEGRRILPLPAWPQDWDCRFKLHAPRQTTVAGTVRGGKVVPLHVEPADRLPDAELLLH